MKNTKYNNRFLEVYEIVGKNITRIRGGMSKTELARRAGVSRGTIESIEKGKSKHLSTLIRVADALNVPIDELFKPIEQKNGQTEEIETVVGKMIKDDGYFIRVINAIVEKKLKEKSKQ